MKTPALLMCFGAFVAPLASSAPKPVLTQVGANIFEFTAVAGQIPGPAARIKRLWTGIARFGRNGQTGSLFARYSDGVTVVLWRAPRYNAVRRLQKTFGTDVPIGGDHLRIAKNGRVAGWTDLFEFCCNGERIPMSVGIYRSGKRLVHISGPGLLYYWNFLGNGGRIVAVWGPEHGPEYLEYQIIDLQTDRPVASVGTVPNSETLAPGAPKWALKAQAAMGARF